MPSSRGAVTKLSGCVREVHNEFGNCELDAVGSWCGLFGWLLLHGLGLVHREQIAAVIKLVWEILIRAEH